MKGKRKAIRRPRDPGFTGTPQLWAVQGLRDPSRWMRLVIAWPNGYCEFFDTDGPLDSNWKEACISMAWSKSKAKPDKTSFVAAKIEGMSYFTRLKPFFVSEL